MIEEGKLLDAAVQLTATGHTSLEQNVKALRSLFGGKAAESKVSQSCCFEETVKQLRAVARGEIPDIAECRAILRTADSLKSEISEALFDAEQAFLQGAWTAAEASRSFTAKDVAELEHKLR